MTAVPTALLTSRNPTTCFFWCSGMHWACLDLHPEPYYPLALDQIILPSSDPLALESPFRGLDLYARAPLFGPLTGGNEVLFH